jgi:RimJ/RimL family protein N-acetyltransferase
VGRTRAESDALADLINAEIEREGWGLWAVEVVGAVPFIGMVGLHRVPASFPFAPAVEIGWRLAPNHWGHGYATEAATASLHHGFASGLTEIVAYTAASNVRSQAVMRHIQMVRDPAADFDHPTLPIDSPLRPHVLYRARRAPASEAPAESDVTAGE